jgi:serine/threonine-protein kinase
MSGAPAPRNGGTYQPPAYSPRTQAVSPIAGASGSPPDAAQAPYSLSNGLNYEATPTDVTRWEMPQVAKFRRRLAFYLIFNIPLVVLSIFRRNDLGGVTTIWTLVLAWQYAKLWTEGYDWRDVLRQPRDRLFGDVLSDLWESVEVTFDRKKRERLRAQGQLRTGLRGALRPAATQPGQGTGSGVPVRTGAASAPTRPMAAPVPDHELGAYRSLVHGAREDREEIARLLATMPESERAQFPAMSATAGELVSTIEQVAKELARTEMDRGPEALARADAEIATLEAEANPLDAERSEARVRRLAMLRRERRALQDAEAQATVRRGQMESCRLALENVRLDLVRLRTGGSSVAGVTEVAERALSLARDVERAVQAQAEVQALMAPRASS